MRNRSCFVWVRSYAGPQPQIWAPDAFEVLQSRIDATVLAIHELTDQELKDAERAPSLRTFAQRFPLPIKD